MRFVDTHCHFDFPPFVDAADVSLRQAADAGVEKLLYHRSRQGALTLFVS